MVTGVERVYCQLCPNLIRYFLNYIGDRFQSNYMLGRTTGFTFLDFDDDN